MGNDKTGHDVRHAHRVLDHAKAIMQEVGGDGPYVVGCCLLHDCLDEKLGLSTPAQEEKILQILLQNGYEEEKAKMMIHSMKRMSFHLHDDQNLSLEDKIIRDADRLDALGMIGVERALAYGEAIGRPFFNDDDRADIRAGKAPHSLSTVSHFFEKLLRLDEGMHFPISKALATKRKEEMVAYLEKRYQEEGLPFDRKLLP